LQEARNCGGQYADASMHFSRYRFRECPLSKITELSHSVASLANHYEAGFLPLGGAVSDQSARTMRLMNVYRAEFSKVERAYLERIKNEGQKHAR